MYVIDILKVDGSNRILISNVFPNDEFHELPKTLVPMIDIDEKTLVLEQTDEDAWTIGLKKQIDSKNRLKLPAWITRELGKVYYIMAEEDAAGQIFGVLYPEKYYSCLPLPE